MAGVGLHMARDTDCVPRKADAAGLIEDKVEGREDEFIHPE